VAVVFILNRKRQDREREKAWDAAQRSEPQFHSMGSDEVTMDNFEFTPGANALAVLTVIQSDDPGMLNKKFEINKTLTTLGRSSDNDIVFRNDNPVSRRHAQIEDKGYGLFISEILSTEKDGTSKYPTYHTFINDIQLSHEPVELKDGCNIRLGKRLVMRFEQVKRTMPRSDESTWDALDSDPEKTAQTTAKEDPLKTKETQAAYDPDKTKESGKNDPDKTVQHGY
jgi:pSer/pThr/pTyr-binding forkhead associated (FHA) protein